MREQDNGGRADLHDLEWLLSQTNAKRNPITRADIRRFGMRPRGPILPETCLEVRSIPESWRYKHDSVGPVLDLAVRSDGEPIVLGVGPTYHLSVIVGDRMYALDLAQPRSGDWAGSWGGHILGALADGTPVVYLAEVMYVGDLMSGDIVHCRARVYAGDQCTRERLGMLAPILLRDGSLLYPVACTWDTTALYHDDAVIIGPESRHYTTLFEGPDGAWYARWECRGFTSDGLGVYGRILGNEHEIVREAGDEHAHAFVITKHNGVCAVLTSKHQPHPQLRPLHPSSDSAAPIHVRGSRPTLSEGILELPGNRLAFVDETARHGQECWVVGNREEPGFDRVTAAVEVGGRWYYWGLIGRHIFRMELPVAPQKTHERRTKTQR